LLKKDELKQERKRKDEKPGYYTTSEQ
jgi:hypothetical protein